MSSKITAEASIEELQDSFLQAVENSQAILALVYAITPGPREGILSLALALGMASLENRELDKSFEETRDATAQVLKIVMNMLNRQKQDMAQ